MPEPSEPTATPTATPPPSVPTSEPPPPSASPPTEPAPSDPAPSDPPPSDPPAEPAEPTTLALDPGGDLPQAVPATWPEDWRQRFAGEDENDLKTLKRFQSPENFWKSYRQMRSKLGTDYYRKMPDTEDEEVLTTWRKEVGIPEAPEGYLEGLPKEMVIDDEDKPFVEDYFKRMHANGVSAPDVQVGLESYYEMKVQETEAILEQDRQNRSAVEDDLRGEWGPEYRPNLGNMHNMLDAYAQEGVKEILFAARMPNGRPLGDDPGVLRLLVALSNEINPQGFVPPVAGQEQGETIATEIKGLEAQMADTKTWAHNKDGHARLRELYQMEEKIAARR